MPLTNPDKVVTEQRLHEYHETIFPYLGGMPDILANKFSRADLYSTDEKMIGRWIDGKPLYQKVIIHNPEITVPTIGSNGATIATIANIETLVDAWCLSTFFNTRTRVINFEKEGNNIIANAAVYSVSINKSIIQYTKTTDSSVEIGSDTDYSTTEKIVGTWIDGKPIYQKTVVSTSIDWNNDNDMGLSSLNIDEIIDYNVIAKRTDDYVLGTSIANPAGFTYQFAVFISPTKLVCVRTGSDIIQLMNKLSLTIRYTKTN